MTRVSDTELQQNLSRYLDEAADGQAPVMVTRQGGKGNIVIVSEAEFTGWQETVHLLSSPRNAERLLRGICQAETNGLPNRDLTEHGLRLPFAE
jgi:antitoxin YefM